MSCKLLKGNLKGRRSLACPMGENDGLAAKTAVDPFTMHAANEIAVCPEHTGGRTHTCRAIT